MATSSKQLRQMVFKVSDSDSLLSTKAKLIRNLVLNFT